MPFNVLPPFIKVPPLSLLLSPLHSSYLPSRHSHFNHKQLKMSRATVELDFFGMEKQISANSRFPKILPCQRSFRGLFFVFLLLSSSSSSSLRFMFVFVLSLPFFFSTFFFFLFYRRYSERHFKNQSWASQVCDCLWFCQSADSWKWLSVGFNKVVFGAFYP